MDDDVLDVAAADLYRRNAGALMRRARDHHGWSQAELARRLGCSPATVAMCEVGSRTPSDDLRVQLAHLLEVDPATLALARIDDPDRVPGDPEFDVRGPAGRSLLLALAQRVDELLTDEGCRLDDRSVRDRLEQWLGQQVPGTVPASSSLTYPQRLAWSAGGATGHAHDPTDDPFAPPAARLAEVAAALTPRQQQVLLALALAPEALDELAAIETDLLAAVRAALGVH